MDLLADLEARGLVQDSTDRDALRARIKAGPVGVYYGCDPSADSLQIGNLVGLLVLIVVAQLGTGAMNALDVFFVTRNLHAAPKYFGFLAVAEGIAAIIGGLTARTMVRWIGAKTLTCLGAIFGGLFVLLYARQTTLAAGLVLIALAIIPFTMLNAAISPLILKVTPPHYLGRVGAVIAPASALSSMVSMAVAGLLASTVLRTFHASVIGIRMGPIDVIFTVSGLLIVVAGLLSFAALPAALPVATDQTPAAEGQIAEPGLDLPA